MERSTSRNNPYTGTQLAFAIRDSSGMGDQTVTFAVEPGGMYYLPLMLLPFSISPADSSCVNASANPTTPPSGASSVTVSSATTLSSSGPTLGMGQPPGGSSASSYVHCDLGTS